MDDLTIDADGMITEGRAQSIAPLPDYARQSLSPNTLAALIHRYGSDSLAGVA
jgi:hypothetical protein